MRLEAYVTKPVFDFGDAVEGAVGHLTAARITRNNLTLAARCILGQSINNLLRDLGHSLVAAMAGSEDVNKNLKRIQEAGYTLYLTIDGKKGAEESAPSDPLEETARPLPEPSFRINTSDLSFLRSIGIDPTRKTRSRRSS